MFCRHPSHQFAVVGKGTDVLSFLRSCCCAGWGASPSRLTEVPEPFWKTIAPDVHHEIVEYLFEQDQDQNKYIRAMLEAVQARRRAPWGMLPGGGGGVGAERQKKPGAGAAATVATVAAATRIMPVGADRSERLIGIALICLLLLSHCCCVALDWKFTLASSLTFLVPKGRLEAPLCPVGTTLREIGSGCLARCSRRLWMGLHSSSDGDTQVQMEQVVWTSVRLCGRVSDQQWRNEM